MERNPQKNIFEGTSGRGVENGWDQQDICGGNGVSQSKLSCTEIQRSQVRDTMGCIFCPLPPNSFRLQGCTYSFYSLKLAKDMGCSKGPREEDSCAAW